MRFNWLLILLAVFLIPFPLKAQEKELAFSKLDIYDGLSHNQVNAILRDQQGFLWFGTMSGLNRYDGHDFKLFRNQQGDTSSLIDNYITALFQLPHEKLWVVTRSVPCVYNSHTEKFDTDYNAYLQSIGLPAGAIRSVEKGEKNRYWFLYENGQVFVYTAHDKKAHSFLHTNSNTAEAIAAIKEVAGDKLWIIYQAGQLEIREISTGKTITHSNALKEINPGSFSYHLYVDKQGDGWLWTTNTTRGLFLYRGKVDKVEWIHENSGPSRLNNNLITGVIQDREGMIWVSTDHGGINLIDKKRNNHVSYFTNDPKEPKSISQNAITTIHHDQDGITWIGTYKKGVNYYNPNILRFDHYHHQESVSSSLPYDDVNRFVEDKKGNIWIGTNGGGLIYFDRTSNSFRQWMHEPANSNSLSNNVVVSLWIDKHDLLWIGTYYGGLSSFDGKKFTQYKHDENNPASLSDDRVWEIFEDDEENLWVGTLNGGLNLLDRQTGRFRHFQYEPGKPSALQDNYISALMQDKQGNLWIGTALGVTVFEKGESIPVHYQHQRSDATSLSNNNVISLHQDGKGRIWVGTREGLNLFIPQTHSFRSFTQADGLPNNTILTITEDRQHTLWVTTPNGLCNIVTAQNGKQLSLTVTNYDESNNLQGREFNENAALGTRNGELIFGGPGGFNIVDPASITAPASGSSIVFTNLQIFNDNIEVGQELNGRILLKEALPHLETLHLKYRENVFSIAFASLGFSGSSRDQYAYKLEGFNDDWLYTDSRQRRITYTNLDPGSYTFMVKVLDNNGSWSPVKSLRIKIDPPFWLSPLAFLLYALVTFGALWLGRKIILDRAHMRFEMQQQRREAERVQSLDRLKTKFFTNVSHEFRTPLSLIISPLERIIHNTSHPDQKKQLHLVQRNAKRLLNLVNQLLDFRKMEVEEIRLHPAIGDIIHFIREISFSFSDIADKKSIEFSFHTDVEHLEIYFDKDKIEKILFNLLSNAYKYTPDHGRVAVNLFYSEPIAPETNGILRIEVSDSGIGIPGDQHDRIFERFFQSEVPTDMVNQGTGIGLAITKEFVKLHNGTIEVVSEPEKGTCFKVSIPARRILINPIPIQETIEIIDEEAMMASENGDSSRRKTILIVEDNEDLRFYLKDNLKADYHVEEAINGMDGWNKVRSLNPHLVVSDIMMPEMDGIELARRIKTGTPTAHIPVILLTAMGNETKQLEGFQIGVSDYITKPFTFEILASRIKNLLAQQKMLQKRFQKQIEVNPGEITVTPLDEQFIIQALAVVERNMDNPDFSVEEFSRDMHMSRVALYKKILSLTGKAPLEFIRSIRLKRAAQLLGKSGRSVSEIAYEVGFNNPKLFSRYFKEEFGVIPSQYPITP